MMEVARSEERGARAGRLLGAVLCGLLALVGVAPAQVMNTPLAAEANRAWLQRLATEKLPIKLGCGTLYVRGTVTFPPTVGCGRIETDGATGDSVGDHPTLNGMRTRIVQLGKGPIFRYAGTGAIGETPLELVGDGRSAAIEVEGRAAPATGRHRFRNWVFRDWGCAFRALGGYYQDGKFVACEAHADNCIVEGCETFNCAYLFWSENQQALNWVFRDSIVNQLGPPSYDRHVVCRIDRGGCPLLERLVIEERVCTVFQVRDWSPNQCRLTARDLFYDRFAGEPGLRILDYVGPANTAHYSDWSLHVDGWSGMRLDPNKLYNVPGDLPRGRWCVLIEAQ